MSQIITKFITPNNIDDTLIRLRNAQSLRARNFANSADVNILEVDASNIVQLQVQTQIATTPTSGNDVANKTYVDTQVGTVTPPTWAKEDLTLNGTDITNQYKDLAQTIKASSLHLSVDGTTQYEGASYDYTLSTVGGKTRVTFVNGLATGGASALVSGDILHVQYQY